MRFSNILIRFFILAALILSAPLAHATLGRGTDSVESDRASLHCDRHTQNASGQAASGSYQEHHLTGPLHEVVEYVNPSGQVFAVRWRGTVRPDLSILFGDYYSEYHAANDARPRLRTRRPVITRTSRLVVHTFLRMRDARGLAYLPSLTPANVNPETFR